MAWHVLILFSGVTAVAGIRQYYQDGPPYKTPHDNDIPAYEKAHDPDRFSESPPRNYSIEGVNFTLDERHSHEFRLPPSTVLLPTAGDLLEENRPYRFITPPDAANSFEPRYNDMFSGRSWMNVGCMCTTVTSATIYAKAERINIDKVVDDVLAGCAVITKQHVLTTASSTEYGMKKVNIDLEINNRPKYKDMWQKGLRVIYDTDKVTKKFHSTLAVSIPSRIHFHPGYTREGQANLSHPVHLNDLAVWTMVAQLHPNAIVCMRGAPSFFHPTTPMPGEQVLAVGYQFIRAYNRKPNMYERYVVKSGDIVQPCPKLDWGWFHCMGGRWAPLGFDNGGGLYRIKNGYSTGMQGLIGLGAFSMHLRSKGIVHYFTVVNTHKNMDFLYNAFLGLQPYEMMLEEYNDNFKWAAPKVNESFLKTEYYEFYSRHLFTDWEKQHPNWRTSSKEGKDFV